MKFFVDTADLNDIKDLAATGLLDGVTTNPSLVAKSGHANFIDLIKEICAIVSGPVSAEVAATEFEPMLAEGLYLAKLAKNIAVKVPLTPAGLKVCKTLSQQGTMVNVTLCFSPAQAILAAKAGATFVSPFVGRLDDIGENGMKLIEDICTIYKAYPAFKTEVLVASVRHPIHVVDAAKLGAHVATCPPAVIRQLFSHPLTDKGLAQFVVDWAKTGQKILAGWDEEGGVGLSKQFKNKTCVYCGQEGASETGDHIFAREFFLPDKRDNIPKVPACRKCNNDKARLEHYLTALLPFGGRHADATANLNMVPPRLAKNAKLQKQLAAGQERVWVNENGIFLPTITLPVDFAQVEELFCLIVKGLLWHHWQVPLTDEHFVSTQCLTPEGERFFWNFFGMNANDRVNVSLADGAIQYEGVQGFDIPQISVWRFSVYGGLVLGGDNASPHAAPSSIWALTARKKLRSLVDDLKTVA